MSLVLCFAMLLGTTLAWFTDTATTGVNRIVAGNLDVEVEYSKTGNADDWATIQDTKSLFSDKLWEPGHTEFVYLKVKNAGTLGLKYKVMVTPVSENGGVNVAGNSFKLSDYLVFGTTDPAAACPSFGTGDAGRAAAREAVGETKGLNQADLTKISTIEASGADQYLALVVYMPETVGNEANAKSGTTAPSIDLGITVVATQMQAELDSFDNTYDAGAATGAPEYVVGPTYDYFPQVMKTVSVTKDADNKVNAEATIEAKGQLNTTEADVTLAKVTVPVGAALTADTTELTVKVVPKEPEAETTNGTALVAEINDPNRETANFDIKVEGIASNNDADINVKVFVGTGLANVRVYHNGNEITGATYTPADGYVTFTTKTFSDFTVAYDAAVAAIGTKTYGSLENAFAAVKAGETITLLKDSAGDGIVVPSGKNFTVDFNSFTYNVNGELVGSSGTETNGFQLLKDSTITFKNGALTSAKAKILIQNYSNLTLENMSLTAGSQCGYVLSNNNGNVVIKDTTINAAEGKVAFDVCRYSSYVGPEVTVEGNSVINGKVEIYSSGDKEGAVHKLNVTGGTFNGEIYFYNTCTNFVGNITGGTFVNDVNAFCAEGYCALEENGRYQIVEGCLVSSRDELVAAEEGSGKTIYLATDFGVGSTVTIDRNVTLDGRGHTLTAYYASPVIDIRGAVDVTLKNININFPSYTGKEGVQEIGTGNKLTFENVNITNAFKGIHFNDCRETAVSIKGCSLTSIYPFNVNGGSISSFVVEDSSLNGWTSFSNQKDNGTYQFKNCSFGEGLGYATVKPYGNTTFDRCTFSADYFANLEGGIASGTTTPIEVRFNTCFMKDSTGNVQALTVDLLKTAFNYEITSGSSSGDSTINKQYWYINDEQLSFAQAE